MKPVATTPKKIKKLMKRNTGFFKRNSKTVNTKIATMPKPAMKEKMAAATPKPLFDSTNVSA